MTKTYELPNDKMIMADVDEKHHTATVSVYILDDLVEAVNKTGHWINDEDTIGCYYCSECGGYVASYDDAYCKYCGAKMVEPQERSRND